MDSPLAAAPWAMIRGYFPFLCLWGVFVSAGRYREGPRPALSEEIATIGVALIGSQSPIGNTAEQQQIIKESNYSGTKCLQKYLQFARRQFF